MASQCFTITHMLPPRLYLNSRGHPAWPRLFCAAALNSLMRPGASMHPFPYPIFFWLPLLPKQTCTAHTYYKRAERTHTANMHSAHGMCTNKRTYHTRIMSPPSVPAARTRPTNSTDTPTSSRAQSTCASVASDPTTRCLHLRPPHAQSPLPCAWCRAQAERDHAQAQGPWHAQNPWQARPQKDARHKTIRSGKQPHQQQHHHPIT